MRGVRVRASGGLFVQGQVVSKLLGATNGRHRGVACWNSLFLQSAGTRQWVLTFRIPCASASRADKKSERPPGPEPHLSPFEANGTASRPHEQDDFWAAGGGLTAFPVRKGETSRFPEIRLGQGEPLPLRLVGYPWR